MAHCNTKEQVPQVLDSIESRLKPRRLELSGQKTRIVYCQDDDRCGEHVHKKFDFLGYTSLARRSRSRWGKHFISFSLAVSREAATRMRQEMRQWNGHLRSDKTIDVLPPMWSPALRGWI